MNMPESTEAWVAAQRLRMRERLLAVALTFMAASTIAIYWAVLTPSLGVPRVLLLSVAEVATLSFVYFIIIAQMRRSWRDKSK